MAYPAPVYSNKATSGTTVGEWIDIAVSVVAGLPPVMIVTFTGTATYTIQGSHDMASAVDFSASLSAPVAKDLVPGVRFWRTKPTANSGTFTSSVGPVPAANGGFATPNNVTITSGPVLD
jgi:hypothetical protein